MKKFNFWCRMAQKEDSDYIIGGIIVMIVSILLNQFIWQSRFAFWSSLIGSVCIASFMALKIRVEEHPEEFPVIYSSPRKCSYGWRFVVGVALINFAVSLVAMAMLRCGGILISFIVWEVIMILMEYNREEYPSAFFWVMIGFCMYLMSYSPVIIFDATHMKTLLFP